MRVYLCTTLSYHGALHLGCDAMTVEHFCAFLFVHVVSTSSVCSLGVKQGRVGALGYVCVCMGVYVGRVWATVDRLLGHVTAGVLFVSCGPLLTPTALLWEASCCDSQYTLWHMHAHIHVHKPHKHWSLVALSLGAVQPGHSRGHLPFTEGESSNIWYLN